MLQVKMFILGVDESMFHYASQRQQGKKAFAHSAVRFLMATVKELCRLSNANAKQC